MVDTEKFAEALNAGGIVAHIRSTGTHPESVRYIETEHGDFIEGSDREYPALCFAMLPTLKAARDRILAMTREEFLAEGIDAPGYQRLVQALARPWSDLSTANVAEEVIAALAAGLLNKGEKNG